MYLATLDAGDLNPSLAVRRECVAPPQSGFSTLIRRIKTRSSVSICVAPQWADFQRQ